MGWRGTRGKGEGLKEGEFRVMLFLACSDDATDTAVRACVCGGEKKCVKNLLCVCVCVRVRERERERETERDRQTRQTDRDRDRLLR